MKTLELSNPKHRASAEQVIVDNGFSVVSSWINNNTYSKEGINYKISHPVWNGNKVRIEKISQ